MSSESVTPIPNKTTHDTILAASATHPTVIYLSSDVLPACQRFAPEYEPLATKHPDIKFCRMEYSSETSPMFKFAQAQLPVVVLVIEGRWCRTLLSPKIGEVEGKLEELRREAQGVKENGGPK